MMDSQNDSWKEYVEDPKEIEAELAEFREKKKLCNQELLSVVEHALADMPNLTPSARFIPQTFLTLRREGLYRQGRSRRL